MKKLFFLFAAAALLTACSSDELSETTGGGGTPTNPDTEQYVSSGTVEFANGTSMSLGMFDENGNPVTRAGETLKFTIDLEQLEDGIFDDVKSYVLKADDFAIRKDGVYQKIEVEGENGNNKGTLDNIEIVTDKTSGAHFLVSVNGLDKLEFTPILDDNQIKGYTPNDWTFETYIWIENKKLLDDGSGSFGELFTDTTKFAWIGQEEQILEYNWRYADWLAANYGVETGQDWSQAIWEAQDAKFSADTYEGGGFIVRYNVYRGLQGKNGDTPYIKVSISVSKKVPTTIGSNDEKNECTWVSIPYTPNKSLSKDSSDILSVK